MYYQKEVIKNLSNNCPYFILQTDLVLVSTKEDLYLYNIRNGVKDVINKGAVYNFRFAFNQFVIFQIENGSSLLVFELKTQLVINELPGNYYLWNSLNHKDNLFIRAKISSEKKNLRIDSNFNVGQIELAYFPTLILDETKYIFQASFISCHSFSENKLLWHADFSKLLNIPNVKIDGEVIAYHNLIFVSLQWDVENIYSFTTLGLDQETGQIVHRIDGLGGRLFISDTKIYSATSYLVQVLNLHTMEFSEINLTEEFAAHSLKISSGRSVIKNDKWLYFIDGSVFPSNRFGIVDLETKKLLWHCAIDVNDGLNNNLREIEVWEDRIFIYASDDTIRIFDRIDSCFS